jgi:hypothetical protein
LKSDNLYAGRPRLDRLDPVDSITPNTPPEKLIYQATIKDAVHNYLFFGLGRNGTTADEFAYSCMYLFNIRSTDPTTWKCKRRVNNTDKVVKPSEMYELSDLQIKNMCFDLHYQYSGLDDLMPINEFITKLKEQRRKIVQENWVQIQEYIHNIRNKDESELEFGKQLAFRLSDEERSLIEPDNLRQVAELLYIPKKLKRPCVKRATGNVTLPMSRIRKTTIKEIQLQLEGILDADSESVSNDGSCSFYSTTA